MWLLRAKLPGGSGALERARSAALKAIELDDGSTSWLELAEAEAALGHRAAAQKALAAALGKTPDFRRALALKAKLR